jgi:hypothetical protein
VAALAAAADPRAGALCLIDPVDNTIYAPLGPGYPSATAALRSVPQNRDLPVAVVGPSQFVPSSMYTNPLSHDLLISQGAWKFLLRCACRSSQRPRVPSASVEREQSCIRPLLDTD